MVRWMSPDDSSMKAGGIKLNGAPFYFYRVTVQVTGPKNTVSYVQAILSE